MNKKGEKLMLLFAILGVLAIGSVVVLATLSTYDREDVASAISKTTTFEQVNNQIKIMGEEDAKLIAKSHAKGTISEIELKQRKSDEGYIYYAIEFKDGFSETEVRVHAYTGAILAIQKEDTSKDAKANALKAAESATSIPEEKAKQIASARLPRGFVFEGSEVGTYNGIDVWELEFSSDTEEADVVINMNTGEVLDVEYESDDEEEEDDEEDEDEDDDEDDD